LGINKNFVVKHGLEVNTNLVLANADTGRVGLGTTNPISELDLFSANEAKLSVRSPEGQSLVDIDSGITSTSQLRFKQNGVLKGDISFNSQTLDVLEINSSTDKSVVLATGGGKVGIATTNPTSELTVSGDVFVSNDVLVNGISTFSGITTVTGETLFSKQLNVSGVSTFNADVDLIQDLNVNGNLTLTGIGTFVGFSTFNNNVYVAGISTFNGLIDANGGATIDNVRIGIADDNEIDTSSGNLTLDSSAGTVIVDDQLSVVGVSTFSNRVIFNSTNSIQIPVGTTAQRDSVGVAVTGQIRYNTEFSTFEGYGPGGSWGSLGGVKDVDGNTYIIPESSPGANENILYFYNNGALSATISSTSTNINTNTNISGVVTASTFYGQGGALTLGTPTDSSITSNGALNTFTGSTKLVDSVDDLNELAFNIIRNTAVTNVDFSSSSLAGGSPLSITLSVTSSGNANRYDVDWGDGTSTSNYTSASIPHTYTQPAGGLFSISLVAKNNSGIGAGSSYSTAKSNYITVYTPNPVVSFDLYRTSTGGSVLSGNDLYVVEGQSLYLDNNTSNTSGATVNYTMNWGDGSSNDSIANNTASGGADVSASRLQHTWVEGTNSSTTRDTLTLTLNAHNTADPAVIPAVGTGLLKVYDDAPAAPDGLSSKTLSNVTSTGTNPRLVSGFTDNTGGTTLSAGNDVTRVTGGTAEATATSTFAYNANSGTLTAHVNGSSDGSRVLTSGDDSGTYTSLVITEESDYQLLNSSGSTTTFAASIYYPGLYKGFKAKVSKAVSALSVGVNSMRLLHSVTGNTNAVQFVKDDVTATPVVSISTATLAENVAGTYRYVSGIPYYNSGSPSLTLSGLTVTNLTGQTYTNQSDIVEVDNGTNQEGTSSVAIVDSDYTYSQINGPSSMLSGGIPIANVGVSSPYAISSLTVPITSSSVRTIDRVRVRAKNVNGTSSYTSDISTNIQVHTAAQSGISEVSIAVPSGLGDGTYTDNGIRIYNFGPGVTTTTPSYNGATNFYTNNPYSESSSPAGITTTAESVVRLGAITHNQVNYSTGYLPVGPNFSSGRSGTQYFTFAFRRRVVANFDINITSSTGVAGVWIAAPGTSIDTTSGLNGWLRADTAYGGSGVPGSGPGGNGSDGCAFTNGDRIIASTSLSGGYTMTLGSENMSNATGNVVLIRIALASGQSVTSLSIGAAA
jgi:hypothetical protein